MEECVLALSSWLHPWSHLQTHPTEMRDRKWREAVFPLRLPKGACFIVNVQEDIWDAQDVLHACKNRQYSGLMLGSRSH